MTRKKTPTPYQQNGFAIVNYVGDLWGPEIFASKDDARDHLSRFWDGKCDWRKFKLVRASTITKAMSGANLETFT